ncbi:c-type cytochrome biogenesis protein CcmI [Loktanella salsilacus]|uniref:c-type cytochrome biogenesis protein CcmI n=1 Tax=Loktanella salsilacus TaxID=195913 RepID=UPI0020B80141|nr:c-type cytochrome biogenesis protein CcmI [Loktanella salsilacus]UTH43249.1 c-type cytochrome biogenesis protein CcmI [Loktanella salsilacus]
MFWIICIVMALGLASLLAAPLLRPAVARDDHPQVAIYKGQLEEVDRDITRGVLNADEAERARAEIARRLLAVSRTHQVTGTAPRSANIAVAGVVGVMLLGVGGYTYLQLGAPGDPDQPLAARLAEAEVMRDTRPDQAALEAAAPTLPPVDAPTDYLEQINQLRTMVPTRPDDLQGWTLLTFHETRLGNYGAAARAQARVVALKGDDVPMEDLEREIDLMVAAANGIVSPEAETVARAILTRDEANVAGRYYIGAIYDQTGRSDIALRFWRPIADSGDTSFHGELIRSQIAGAAARAGVEYELPDLRGPGAADIAAAEDMTEEDRTAMIGGMVAQLAGRLAAEGGPAADWARLISAYGVLGQTEEARTVYTEAQTAFAGDNIALQAIETAAQSAGVAE